MNYFNLYWGAVLLLLPFWIRIESVPVDMRFAKDMFFIACSLISLLVFRKRKKIDFKIILISSYLMFMAFYNQWFITSFAVIYQWTSFSLGLLCFIQFVSNIGKKDETFYLDILSISAIAQSILVVFTHFDINIYFYLVKMFNWGANYKIGTNAIPYLGSLGNPMIASTFISITTISLLRKKWFFFLPLPLFAIYLTSSTTGTVACIAGLSTYFMLKHFKSKKKTFSLLGILGVLGTILVAFYRNQITFLNDSFRFLVWKKSFELIDGFYLITGKGLGFFADNYNVTYQKVGENFRHLHNEYLEIFFAFGIIGLILFGISLFVMLKRANNPIIISTVVAYLVTMITGLTLHISATALIGILLVALCLNKGEENGFNYSNKRA